MVFNPVTNPVIGGFNPDPSICRVGSDYFLATSTFEYFPGVPIYHSRDLVNWTVIGHALTRPSQLYMPRVEPSGGIFAPTLRYWKGRFYMATCCVYRRNNRIVRATVSAPIQRLTRSPVFRVTRLLCPHRRHL